MVVGLTNGFGERHRRQLEREAAGLQHAALHVLGARPQVRVAGIDVAPGVDDADHRLAAPSRRRRSRTGAAASDGRTSANPDAEPAMAAQVFGLLSVVSHERDCCRRTRGRRGAEPATGCGAASTDVLEATSAAITASPAMSVASPGRPGAPPRPARRAATLASPVTK